MYKYTFVELSVLQCVLEIVDSFFRILQKVML